MGGRVIATVVEWRDDEGWGLAFAEDYPGGIWVHFSALHMDGERALAPGTRIDATVDGPLEDSPNGYPYRVRSARPVSRLGR
jgi:CspA family cold shock protein